MAQQLFNAQVHPARYGPLRQPTFPNLERTSTLSFSKVSTIQAGTEGAPECRLALFRSPVYPVWADLALPNGVITSGAVQVAFQTAWILPNDPGERTTVPDVRFGIPLYAGFQPYVPTTPVVGQYHGNLYTYVPWGMKWSCYLVLSAANTTIAGDWEAEFEVVCFRKDQSPTSTLVLPCIAGTNNVVTFTSGTIFGGWIRLLALTRAATTTTTNMRCTSMDYTWAPLMNAGGVPIANTAATAVLLPWMEPPEFTTSTLPYSDTRAIASALRITNVSKVLSKEGTVLATRVPISRADPWSDGFQSASVRQAHPRDRYYGALEKGLYAFSIGDGSTGEFRQCAQTSTVGSHPVFQLDGVEYFGAIICTDPNPSTATVADSTVLALEASMGIEFRNSSQLFDVGESKFTIEDMHRSQQLLFKRGCFHAASTPPQLSQAQFGPVRPKGGNRKQTKDRTKPGPKSKQTPNGKPKKGDKPAKPETPPAPAKK